MYHSKCSNHVNRYDFGGEPYVTNIRQQTCQNPYFRRALWTGDHLQLTLMCIPVYGEVGLEVHNREDQFLRIESGQGWVEMGPSRSNMYYQCYVKSGDAIFVPAGYWHNLVNVGATPLALYSIYAPPHHEKGTLHRTKEEADHDHHNHHH
ncbi:Mannose-6-phosphate isomerase, cupin superfamily [Pelagirhabdus alkalitolerans]|uniref:Mannose-6-phosphate isomerase, cupin superfamily n=1 Tax=Pelagirhabdus alkalitolerans TaxID=1612202 RepID=A0A1G6IM78_9BACI|nr:cupin domain-containing protein [Pelagirhabdus alkalitolerans]SDC07608.1 Mannose-6-phosphate isomerase, cupin superfamily [Pelagirhabdus alkalitolerans]